MKISGGTASDDLVDRRGGLKDNAVRYLDHHRLWGSCLRVWDLNHVVPPVTAAASGNEDDQKGHEQEPEVPEIPIVATHRERLGSKCESQM